MKPSSSPIGTAFALLTVTATLLAGACGRSDSSSGSGDPGITDTELNIGQSDPLTGASAAPGTCNLAGWQAYLGRVNDSGGVKFGDGKTRTINLKGYDDGYDPARAAANFRQMVADDKFADVGSLGTPTNLAVMPQATAQKVPQAFVSTGSGAFVKDQAKNPWTIGWQPTYLDEGKTLGKFLADSGKPLSIAVLAQNDQLGKDYTAGLQDAIKDSQVKVTANATYEPTDATVDSQISNLARSDADILFLAVSVPKLAAASLTRAQQIGWKPRIFLASLVSNPNQTIVPGNGAAYPAIWSTTFIKDWRDPTVAKEPDVAEFLRDMRKYSGDIGESNIVNNCVWGYATAATFVRALQAMKSPTRKALMDAIRTVKADDLPLVLPGISLDASSKTTAPMTELKIQQFVDGKYTAVDEMK
jgi:branched-chain amino acid transport system substrate-binding protein